jgi:hypothetical protein
MLTEQARAEPINRQHWLQEEARWRDLASKCENGLAISITTEHELVGGKLIPKLPKSG